MLYSTCNNSALLSGQHDKIEDLSQFDPHIVKYNVSFVVRDLYSCVCSNCIYLYTFYS